MLRVLGVLIRDVTCSCGGGDDVGRRAEREMFDAVNFTCLRLPGLISKAWESTLMS